MRDVPQLQLADLRMSKQKYFIYTTLKGMTLGLFVTLIVGTIIQQFALLFGGGFGDFLLQAVANPLKQAMGIGIGVGVALALKLDGPRILTAGIIGVVATSFKVVLSGWSGAMFRPSIGLSLDPLTAYLVTIAGIGLLKVIFRKKTSLDILLIPLCGALLAAGLTYLISGPIGVIVKALANFIDSATQTVPFLMVIVISVTMGMILTSPISSAAIAFMLVIGTNPVAAAAAVLGTTVQMVGFAVQTARDNKAGATVSVAIGTSMLQFKNILKNPFIWLPTIVTSAVLAPFILLFGLPFKATGNIADAWTLGAGMGSSGLVGQVQTFAALGFQSGAPWIFVLVLQIAAPIVLVGLLDALLRKLGLIKEKDLEI